MARMNLRLRRDAPGMSVFWMILIVGAGVFLLLAIVLITANGETEPIDAAGEQTITAGEGDEVPGTTSFTEGEVADETPGEPGELPGEAGELDEGVPPAGQANDTEAAGTVGAVDADPAEAAVDDEEAADEGAELPVETEPADDGGIAPADERPQTAPEADAQTETEEEIVVDPDGVTGAVDPTPVGPEGRDEEVIIEED